MPSITVRGEDVVVVANHLPTELTHTHPVSHGGVSIAYKNNWLKSEEVAYWSSI